MLYGLESLFFILNNFLEKSNFCGFTVGFLPVFPGKGGRTLLMFSNFTLTRRKTNFPAVAPPSVLFHEFQASVFSSSNLQWWTVP